MSDETVKAALVTLNDYDTSTEDHDKAALAAWRGLSPGQKECLQQLLFKGPVWDGDIVSKSARGDLFEFGLAVRCCFKGEQGYTAATYPAYTLYRASNRHIDETVTVLRSEINRITGDFNALGAERDSARALLKLAFQELVIGRQNYTLRGRIAAELEK